MKVIYIAGPFRGPNAWEIERNIRRAEEIALACWRLGAAVICPHANTRFFTGAAPDEVWLEGDMELLKRSDAVMLTENWSRSSGATAEREEARRFGLPVFESLEQLSRWLKEVK